MFTSSTTRKRAAERDCDCESADESYEPCEKRQRAETAVDQVCVNIIHCCLYRRLDIFVFSADACGDSGDDS